MPGGPVELGGGLGGGLPHVALSAHCAALSAELSEQQ